MDRKTSLSVIIPVYNEESNILPLYHELDRMLTEILPCFSSEIIFVDDGSTDQSVIIIQSLASNRVRTIQLRRNYGKTAALLAGFQAACGQIIVTMDADLQDDPADLPKLLKSLNGVGMVSGWRINRAQNDPKSKTIPSLLYNMAVRKLTGVNLHDFNCGYKVYRREVLENLRLYGDLHRFMPVLIAWQGYKVSEVQVNHRPRHAGQSKFGAGRLLRGFVDFIMVLFLTRYLHQPLRLFGPVGFAFFGAGMAANLYLAALWLIRAAGLVDVPPIGTRPLLLAGVLAVIFGVQLISIGLLGEMIRYFSFRPDQEYGAVKCGGDDRC